MRDSPARLDQPSLGFFERRARSVLRALPIYGFENLGETDTLVNTHVLQHLTKRFDWLKPVQGHENVITLRVVDLPVKRERLDLVINEIVRNRSLFA